MVSLQRPNIISTFLFFSVLLNSSLAYEYSDLLQKPDSLFLTGDYEAAIDLYEEIRNNYPELDYAISYQLVTNFIESGLIDKAMAEIQNGHKKKQFYGFILQHPQLNQGNLSNKYKLIKKHDISLKEKADNSSCIEYKIYFPEDSAQLNPPCLLIFHGGNSSIEIAQSKWESEAIRNNYYRVYIQSYIHTDMNHYSWRIADQRTRNEINVCLQTIKKEYQIKPSSIILCGISAGGYVAMDFILNNILDVKGFFVIAPATVVEDFDPGQIRAANASDKHGFIITGENDYLIDDQKRVIEYLKTNNFNVVSFSIPNMGHTYPQDLDYWIDRAIQYICKIQQGGN